MDFLVLEQRKLLLPIFNRSDGLKLHLKYFLSGLDYTRVADFYDPRLLRSFSVDHSPLLFTTAEASRCMPVLCGGHDVSP